MIWKPTAEFNSTGTRQTIAGSATGNTPGSTVLVERVCPAGAAVILEKFSAKVVDAGFSDQIYFAILRNGAPIAPGYDRIPGIQFDFLAQFDLGIFVPPGTIQIVGYNISGMNTGIEPDALGAAVDVRCQSWWNGKLLAQSNG